MEEQTAGFTKRIQAAVDAHSVQLLAASAVDLQDLEARSDVPDMGEGDVTELAAPLHGDADAAEESVDHVTQVLAAVEAFVGVGPHAVHGVDSFRLSQHIFEGDLEHLHVAVSKGCILVINVLVFRHSSPHPQPIPTSLPSTTHRPQLKRFIK